MVFEILLASNPFILAVQDVVDKTTNMVAETTSLITQSEVQSVFIENEAHSD